MLNAKRELILRIPYFFYNSSYISGWLSRTIKFSNGEGDDPFDVNLGVEMLQEQTG